MLSLNQGLRICSRSIKVAKEWSRVGPGPVLGAARAHERPTQAAIPHGCAKLCRLTTPITVAIIPPHWGSCKCRPVSGPSSSLPDPLLEHRLCRCASSEVVETFLRSGHAFKFFKGAVEI